jgi:hypothetical protein
MNAILSTDPHRTSHQRSYLSLLPIQERFALLSQAVEMVASQTLPSLILVGPPGLGKTYEVTRTLNVMGLERDHDYFHIKGYTSARGLYESLYRHNGRLLVYDDCDNALKDPVALELLKGALDSYDVRTISWLTAVKGGPKIPPRFDFDGAVIFISNRSREEINDALHSRSIVIDLQMNRAEILERMESILPRIATSATDDQRRTAMHFIRASAPSVQQLNLRTLLSVLRIMEAHPKNWERFARYVITQ